MIRVNVDSLEVPSQGNVIHHRGSIAPGQTKTDKGTGLLLEYNRHLGSRDRLGFHGGLGVQGDDKWGAEAVKH